MNKYFEVFGNMVDLLLLADNGTDNVRITGSNVLMAHGLELGRECADLDLVIYDPTSKQDELVNCFKGDPNAVFTESGSPVGEQSENDNEETHQFTKRSQGTLTINNLSLNILFEYNKSKPDLVLYFKYNEKFYPVQSIKSIIDAKRSYLYNSETKGHYVRRKEAEDFFALKNNNFNL